jgi:DNA-binding NarL/FixJ family response regulator
MSGSKMTDPAPDTSTVRTVLVDDHHGIRAELAARLGQHRTVEIVGEAENGQQAVEMTRTLRPDLVVMDINMPELDGMAATRSIKALPDAPRVILVSFESERWGEAAARQSGADGFCDKVHVARDLFPIIDRLFPD